MKANLLMHLDSFIWNDLTIDRSKLLDDLALAVDCCNSNKDAYYSHPDCFTLTLSWGHLHEILYDNNVNISLLCSWLTRDHKKTLIKIFSRGATSNFAKNLTDLNSEFRDDNNGWLGITAIEVPQYVSNEESWNVFHQQFIANNYASIDKGSAYFKKHYIPDLRVDANQINDQIDRGLLHSDFKRLDSPKKGANGMILHGEQYQMHFNDKKRSALNIDGTWKHAGYDIPNECKDCLIEWGFLLPEKE